jgi:hypothetical protein
MDYKHVLAQNHTYIFNTAASVMRVLKSSHPEYIVDVIMLAMPKLGQPYGTTHLSPSGLGQVAIERLTEDMVDRLLVSMDGSKTLEHLQHRHLQVEADAAASHAEGVVVAAVDLAATDIGGGIGDGAVCTGRGKGGKASAVPKAAKDKAAAALAKAKAKALAKVKAAARDAPEQNYSDAMRKDNYLEHWAICRGYLHKIDIRQKDKIDQFKYLVLAGQMSGKIGLRVAGVEKKVVSFQVLQKIFKTDVYRLSWM